MARKPEDNTLAGNAARENIAKQQREHRRRNRGNVEEASWRDANAALVLAAIDSLCRQGCAIQFGLTRDGSAFVVRIVGDGEPYNEYVRPSEDVNIYLEGLAQDFAK